MSHRAKSLRILKYAVQNKTLSCYNPEVKECKYYEDVYNTCCAVGVLVPMKQLKRHLKSGKCSTFRDKDADGPVRDQMRGLNFLYGLTKDELIKLQGYHDECICLLSYGKNFKAEALQKFEAYVNELQ
jgi:hypothetical protein